MYIKNYRKILFSFIIGFLIGCIVMFLLTGMKIDKYYTRCIFLENIITEKDKKLNQLEDKLITKNWVVKDIKILIEMEEDDDIHKIELEKTLYEKYSVLIGTKVEDIDTELITQIADNTIFIIDDRTYVLNCSKIIVSNTIQLNITSKEVKK